MSLRVPVQAVPPTEAIVNRVANCEGVDPIELDVLCEAIDPDALDRLVRTAEQSGSPLQITFTYHGYEVTVTGEGVVHVDEENTSQTRLTRPTN